MRNANLLSRVLIFSALALSLFGVLEETAFSVQPDDRELARARLSALFAFTENQSAAGFYSRFRGDFEDTQFRLRRVFPLRLSDDRFATGHELMDAFERARSSADDSPEAALALASYYFNGLYVERDPTEGLRLLTMSANADNADALAKLGYLHDVGFVVAFDQAKALSLYQRSAQISEAHLPYVANVEARLGQMYEYGLGTTRDYKIAMDWYIRANNSLAELVAGPQNFEAYSVGRMFALGEGVPQDYPQAASWFAKAERKAAIGDTFWISDGAVCALAIMYAGGLGVPQDPQRAARLLAQKSTTFHCPD